MNYIFFRIFFLLLVILNIYLIYQCIWAENGYLEYVKLREFKDELQGQIQRVKQENLQLSKSIRLIKNNSDYLEMVIRKEMGYVQPDEILYVLSKRKN